MNAPLHAFAGYGIELEYMIVDRQTLSVVPIADELLRREAGHYVTEVQRGELAWSNELVLHLVELKNPRPTGTLESLPALFQREVQAINQIIEPFGACLMPTAMHPWMNPLSETRLWPHEDAAIYQAYDRIFDCNRHGWANLQSMHLNLSFADDAEFARLHAAVRLVLPILPALAASSPIADGRCTGFMDYRMESYRTHPIKVPSMIGHVIPDTFNSRAAYESQVLAPMYRDIAALDPQGVLRHEWLNCRGAIPRFGRNAIEIRVIDVQECPAADLAIAAAVSFVLKMLYDAAKASLEMQQSISTEALADIMLSCNRDGEQAVIDNDEYLRIMGFPARHCEARELWQHLIDGLGQGSGDQRMTWLEPLRVILEHGTLSRRILEAVGSDCSKPVLEKVYRELCACLAEGRMFHG